MIQFKRYLAFGFDEFYPDGGWADYLGTTDDLTEATAWVKEHSCGQVVDTHSDIVDKFGDDDEVNELHNVVFEWSCDKDRTGWRARRHQHHKHVKAWIEGGRQGPQPLE